MVCSTGITGTFVVVVAVFSARSRLSTDPLSLPGWESGINYNKMELCQIVPFPLFVAVEVEETSGQTVFLSHCMTALEHPLINFQLCSHGPYWQWNALYVLIYHHASVDDHFMWQGKWVDLCLVTSHGNSNWARARSDKEARVSQPSSFYDLLIFTAVAQYWWALAACCLPVT